MWKIDYGSNVEDRKTITGKRLSSKFNVAE